jgi:hypothetical protein
MICVEVYRPDEISQHSMEVNEEVKEIKKSKKKEYMSKN